MLADAMKFTSLTIVPGVYDALSALLCKTSGFDTLFLSGAAFHAAALGRADLGLLSANEVADEVWRISDRVDCTLIVDADTGFGGTHHIPRTVTLLERAGAAVVQIEDQLAIKPRDQLLQRPVASVDEMVGRIKAATDARRSSKTLISARTDALSSRGIDEAIDRANRYAEAGADLLFVQSLTSQDQVAQVSAKLADRCPLVIHLPGKGVASEIEEDGLASAGFQYGLRPDALVRASASAMAATLRELSGTTASLDLDAALGGLSGA